MTDMNCIILTGNKGDIGCEIEALLVNNGFKVIGIDLEVNKPSKNQIVHNLETIHQKSSYKELYKKITSMIGSDKCVGLINNAAVQILGNIKQLELSDFEETIKVNLMAPLALSKMLYNDLVTNKGNIINIGSVHSDLTKPNFISYSTSKAGLKGLTKSMAVDFGNKIKVNMISPAAVDTQMLRNGFNGNEDKLTKLKEFHPANSIGNQKDLAKLVLFIIENNVEFLNGSIIEYNGGISSRLHDPE
jgi:NAD(P)-dependent dehydrogenase (short-subunit alcohol dehydrogenase family)